MNEVSITGISEQFSRFYRNGFRMIKIEYRTKEGLKWNLYLRSKNQNQSKKLDKVIKILLFIKHKNLNYNILQRCSKLFE